MSYVEQNLMPGERVVYRTRLHLIIFAWPAFFAVLGLPVLTGDDVPLATFCLGVAVVTGVAAYLRRQSSEFAVTDRRVIAKTGVVQRRTAELLLTHVESLSVDQGILGRALGYGTIVVTGSGAGRSAFKRVADPLELRRHVYAQVEAERAPVGNTP